MSEHPKCDCHDCTQYRQYGIFANVVSNSRPTELEIAYQMADEHDSALEKAAAIAEEHGHTYIAEKIRALKHSEAYP